MVFNRDTSLPRPSIPVALQCGALLWVGCLVGGALGLSLAAAAGLLVFYGIVALITARVCFRHRRAIVSLNLVVLFFVLGIVLTSVAIQGLHHKRDAILEIEQRPCMVRIVDDPSKGSFGYSATAIVWNPGDGLVGRLFGSCKVTLNYSENEFSYGDEFLADARFSSFRDEDLARFDKKGIAARCSVPNVRRVESSGLGFLADVRRSFAASVNERFSFDGANQDAVALVQALVVGDRRALFEGDLYGNVKVAGLAHLVAVSGAHLVIVMGLVSSLVRALRIPRSTSFFLQVGFLLLYLIMVGLPVSCIRAAFMVLVGLLSIAPGKRSYALSSLGVTVLIMLMLDPYAAFSISFGLSALSTLGIVLFSQRFASWAPNAGRRFSALVVEPFAMTCAALLLTFPLSISCFSQFSLVSPLSNILAVPLVTVACSAGVVAFALQPFAPLFDILIYCSYLFSMLFAAVVGFLASLPFPSVPVDAPLAPLSLIAVLLCVSLWVAWPKKPPLKSMCCVLSLALAFFAITQATEREKTSITMLDVGQGDSFLLKSKGTNVLIDTGNDAKKLYAGLARRGVTHLDGIVVSHADDDHCGCLKDMCGVVSVDAVYVAKGMEDVGTPKASSLIADSEKLAGENGVCELSVGEVMNVGAIALQVISPASLTDEGENADSLCLLASSDLDGNGKPEWRALFAGDAESEVLDALLGKGLLKNVDILKVSHHGAKASLDEELVGALQPKIALISVGERNRYGHPAPNTLSLLESCNAEVFRSDVQGDVVCNLTQDAISIQAMK